MTVTVTVTVILIVAVTGSLLRKKTKQCVPSAGADVMAFLGTLGYKQYAPALAQAGFACMAELALITTKALKACKVLDGHALRIVDELKKRRALGVVPQKQAGKRPLDASSFMDLRKKRHKKEARK